MNSGVAGGTHRLNCHTGSRLWTRNLLLAADLRYCVVEEGLAHFVIHAVLRLPLSAFALNSKGCGDEQYPPHIMLASLIYGHANGIFGSHPIKRATHRDVAVRYLTGNTQPDRDTIHTFQRLSSRST